MWFKYCNLSTFRDNLILSSDILFKAHPSLFPTLSIIPPECPFKSTHPPFCNSSPPPPVSGTGQALTPPTTGGEYSLSLSFLPLSPSLRGRKGIGVKLRK